MQPEPYRPLPSTIPKKRWHIRWRPVFTLLFCLLAPAVTGLVLSAQPKNIIVALDAGHGGSDPGASGVVVETALSETTVRFLNDILSEDPAYSPVLTRRYEDGATIRERCQAASRSHARLFLSIHGNYSELEEANGFECYPVPPGRSQSDESVRLAREIVEEMKKTGISIRGINGIRYAYYIPDENGNDVKTILESNQPGISYFPSFGVLEGAGCPAVLVEQCFVTNDGDVSLLGTEAGCRRAAFRYYQAICRYFGTTPVFDAEGNRLSVKK